MDHHGLLTLTRALSVAFEVTQVKRQGPPDWSWAVTPVVYPESHCPFCKAVVRSPGVWCLRKNEGVWQLVGAFFPRHGGKLTLVSPSHPHDTGGGYLCIGYNRDAVALLASTPNILDAPMGHWKIPQWLKEYWNHQCDAAAVYLRSAPTWREHLERYLQP